MRSPQADSIEPLPLGLDLSGCSPVGRSFEFSSPVPVGPPPFLDQVGDAKPVLAPPVEGNQTAGPEKRKFLARWLENSTPWLTSMVIHAVLVVMLALLFVEGPWGEGGATWTAGFSDDAGGLALEEMPSEDPPAPDADQPTAIARELDLMPVPVAVEIPRWTPTSDGIPGILTNLSRGGMAGRKEGNRRRLALIGGGTPDSEAAVELGLAWLAAHQFSDGSWRFDFRKARQCNGQCKDHGSISSTTAATGLSLLAFLGAGYTHREGPYQEAVNRGLYHLMGRMKMTKNGGDLRDGSSHGMYCHAIATLALCEAYAMTEDTSLVRPAQSGIDFIVYAQHKGGGWRYYPQQPGDTTVTGWQVIALKSAVLAGLQVPSPVWHDVERFLNKVGSDYGAYYGYQRPGREPTNTAIGLLSRMMLGWDRDKPPLRRGIAYLGRHGPSENDMYFNYYTTQVMHHNGGYEWKLWNERLRDFLVATQAKNGHERGSWQFAERYSRNAGRLYNTAMTIMTLEVYYRYMPIYDKRAAELAP